MDRRMGGWVIIIIVVIVIVLHVETVPHKLYLPGSRRKTARAMSHETCIPQ
jgi:hypothetical protein